MSEHYVYILVNKRNGTLYVGMTEDLGKRVVRHKSKTASQFTKDYEVNQLVYFEKYKDKQTASVREKQLKKYNRRWKIRLIEQLNPTWRDLSIEVINTKNPGSPAENARKNGECRFPIDDLNQRTWRMHPLAEPGAIYTAKRLVYCGTPVATLRERLEK